MTYREERPVPVEKSDEWRPRLRQSRANTRRQPTKTRTLPLPPLQPLLRAWSWNSLEDRGPGLREAILNLDAETFVDTLAAIPRSAEDAAWHPFARQSRSIERYFAAYIICVRH